jgi:hypothetical protein
MEVDFDDVEEVSDFVSIPDGTYLCEVVDVRVGQTRNGDQRWSLRLAVVEGEYAGRHAAWDNLMFTAKAKHRLRKVLQAFGLPVAGRVQLEPKDLERRRAFVTVRSSEYATASGGIARRSQVAYDGYQAVQQGATPPEEETDRIPF